jgi:hypothetical protein
VRPGRPSRRPFDLLPTARALLTTGPVERRLGGPGPARLPAGNAAAADRALHGAGGRRGGLRRGACLLDVGGRPWTVANVAPGGQAGSLGRCTASRSSIRRSLLPLHE